MKGSPPDSAGLSPSGDIPSGYQEEVDRIFFDYLNDLCSDRASMISIHPTTSLNPGHTVNAKDDNGEPIHQTLMPKKMKRLDESHDFRPFKFRIAAFTHCFMVRLAKEGYPEDKIPSKKVRFSGAIPSWPSESQSRSAIIYGSNHTSSVSTKRARRQSRKATISGTSTPVEQQAADGTSVPISVNLLASLLG